VAEARERVQAGNKLCAGGPEIASVVDRVVESNGSSVPVRIYENTEQTERVLVYVHGGSWITGGLDYADEVCRFLARDASCAVVSVDYRLAPEHPYPAALHDVGAVLRWTRGRYSDAVLGLMGDSAGGNLAAATVIDAQREGPRIDLQVLVYPVVDHDVTRPSYVANSFPISRDDMVFAFDLYVPDPALRADPRVSPLRLPRHAGLPPTHLVVAGHDPLHDEGVEYAERLASAGVSVTWDDHAELVHGFLRFTAASQGCAAARDRLVNRVRDLFTSVESQGAAADPGVSRMGIDTR
jgi:acetyl esterase